jgi:hypothetical protein
MRISSKNIRKSIISLEVTHISRIVVVVIFVQGFVACSHVLLALDAV